MSSNDIQKRSSHCAGSACVYTVVVGSPAPCRCTCSGCEDRKRAASTPFTSLDNCKRCHTVGPNPNGCAACNHERLGERLRSALAALAKAEHELELSLALARLEQHRAEVAEAKLEKAKAALEVIGDRRHPAAHKWTGVDPQEVARRTLADLRDVWP